MRTIRTIFTAAFVVIASLNYSIAEEIIQISTGEWTPYISEKLKHNGVVSHIVSEAFALEGIKVKYSFMPWKRAMREAKVGNYEASIIWSKSEKRQKFLLYSEPVMPKRVVYFHLKSYDFKWNNLDDLKGLTVGGTIGYWYADMYEPLVKSGHLSVEWVKTDEMSLNKLMRSRIDIVALDIGAGYAMIQEEFSPKQQKLITHHPKIVNKPKYNHLVMPINQLDSKRLMKTFNRGLIKLKDSGLFDQFYEKSQQGEYRLGN